MKALFNFMIVGATLTASSAFASLDPCAPVALACSKEIQCSYDDSNGSQEVVSFVGPEDVNLRRLNDGAIPLHVKGSAEETVFKVKTELNGHHQTTVFEYKNPFFKSDIHLTYKEDRLTNANFIEGTWTTDDPSTIQLSCHFVNNWK